MNMGKMRVGGICLLLLAFGLLSFRVGNFELIQYVMSPWPSVPPAIALLIQALYILTTVSATAIGCILAFFSPKFFDTVNEIRASGQEKKKRQPTIDDPW